MDCVGFGRAIRAIRRRKGWRQRDLARAAQVSQSLVSRIERGGASRIAPDTLAQVARPLAARVEVRLSWQGEGLDRLLDADHAALVEEVARRLLALAWEVRTEVSFAIWGERGSVDVLAFHVASRTVLVIEVKSVVPDVQATLIGLDRKARLALEIAASLGWHGRAVSRLLVISGDRTSRRRVERHEAIFRAALPDRSTAVRAYLGAPGAAEPIRGLLFVTPSRRATPRQRQRCAPPER
jgi:transcriptional regulator with XRE-family HTH domain